MRFPNLYNFFRRSRSDTALIAKPSRSVPRPASVPFIDQIPQSDDLRSPGPLSEILASVPVQPFVVKTPLPISRAETSRQHDGRAHDRTVASLTKRVHQLETALRTQGEENERVVSVLEEALKAKAAALKDARDTNTLLVADISRLQSDIMHTRGELYTTLNYQLRFPSGSESERNTALSQENDRLRKFTELVISCGSHTSVLAVTASRVEQGYDPEDSIVDAIKVAMEDPGNVWRRLLHPLVGSRTPQDYLAQTKCTLKARRESRDWQKKARFWKDAAREDGRHTSTVTPSTSQLSDLVSEVSPERRVALDSMLEKLREGCLPLTVESRRASSGLAAMEQTSKLSVSGSQETTSAISIGRLLGSASQVGLTTIVESASESEPDQTHGVDDYFVTTSDENKDVNVPSPSSRTLHPGSAPSDMSVVSLAPLASVAFRESHSIRSLSSRRRRSHRLTPSNSMSSQDSRISRLSDRKAKVFAASRSVSFSLLNVSSVAQPRTAPSPECPGSSNSAEELARMLSAAVEAEYLLVDGADVTTRGKTEPKISRASSSDTDRTQTAATEPNATTTSIANLASDVVSTPPRQPRPKVSSPERGKPLPSPNTTITPISSPDAKKSKLPVLKLASVSRSIRRLSISRPVLVDTTNAGAAPSPSMMVKSGFVGIKNPARGDEMKGRKEEGLKPVVRSRLQMMSPKTKSRMKAATGFSYRSIQT